SSRYANTISTTAVPCNSKRRSNAGILSDSLVARRFVVGRTAAPDAPRHKWLLSLAHAYRTGALQDLRWSRAIGQEATQGLQPSVSVPRAKRLQAPVVPVVHG